MPTALDTHSPEQIHAVARGLMAVVDVDQAASQLRRLYGEDRTAAALVTLARQARSARRTYVARQVGVGHTGPGRPRTSVLGPRQIGVRPAVAVAATSTRARRGSRPGDWL